MLLIASLASIPLCGDVILHVQSFHPSFDIQMIVNYGIDLFSLRPSATNTHYVLGGQHIFEAACRISHMKEKASEPVPKYAVSCAASFPPFDSLH